MTYYLVKLKPDCRWLDDGGDWGIDRKKASRFGTRFAAHDEAHASYLKPYNTGDIVIVRVRTVKRKVIPVPKVEVRTSACLAFYEVRVNGVWTGVAYTTNAGAQEDANFLRRALGIPEST